MQRPSVYQFGIIKIGTTMIGIPIDHLSEVFRTVGKHYLPRKGDLLNEGIDLRGRIIPMLNLGRLACIKPAQADPEFGVVIRHEQRLLGFLVDDVVGFATVEVGDLQVLSSGNTEDPDFFKTVFRYQDQFVSVLDIDLLFSTRGVLSVKKANSARAASSQMQQPVLTFEAGGALYAVNAVEVFAAIPKQQINKTAMAAGPCLGEIIYHGRRIPVMSSVQIFGLGQSPPRNVTEIVALRFPNDLVLGFAVDAIHSIGAIPAGRKTGVPLWHHTRDYIDHVVICEDSQQIYAINLEKLVAADDLAAIAGLSRPEIAEQSVFQRKQSGTENITREKNRYLVIEAPDRFAIPLSQINRIVPFPKQITASQSEKPGFTGYFAQSGESVALYDLATCLGHGGKTTLDPQVLLTGPAGHQIGFAVGRVVNIEMSEWAEKRQEGDDITDRKLVQLGESEKAVVLPAFDLLDAIGAHRFGS